MELSDLGKSFPPTSGLGPETKIARAIHTWTAMRWSDKSRVRLFNFAKEDYPSYCTSGLCWVWKGKHWFLPPLVGEKLDLPEDCDEWGRQKCLEEERTCFKEMWYWRSCMLPEWPIGWSTDSPIMVSMPSTVCIQWRWRYQSHDGKACWGILG